ncbi:GerAB/ArcD/ProY family transporter [Rossellomorea vietnamensis]|uniref:GerAB/ArcD/ProY family transporter n=2 Tax=Rossellomorea vietnamensis TaxID=218284 RepID=A0A5D4NRH3_9BACI|nr:GerAB/ArcD/ProY family transporter [Rossellomorea vietnamensis]
MYILSHTGLILFMYPADIIESTNQGHWIPIMIGVIVHFIILSLFLRGLNSFPDKDIISIYLKKGKFIASIFLFPLFLYLLMAGIITVRSYSEIVTIVFLSKTPLWAIMSLFLILASYTAAQGIDGIIRTGVFLFLLLFPLLFFIMLTSFQNVDWRYVHPLMLKDFSFLKKSSYYRSYFAIGGVFLFLGYLPSTIPVKKKSILFAALLIAPIFFLSVYIPILTFGQATAPHFLFPFVMVVDAVNLIWFMFDRFTMFFLLSVVIFILLFLSLVLWMLTTTLTKTIVPSIKPVYLIMVISVIIFTISLLISDWKGIEMLFQWNTYIRFYVILGIPFSIFLLGLIEERGQGA